MRTLLLSPMLLLTTPSWAEPISVAILDQASNEGSEPALRDQLLDSTVFDFEVTILEASGSMDLSGFDVVVVGDSGYSDRNKYSAETTAVISSFHNAGGGTVYGSWASYTATSTIDPVVPIDQANADGRYCTGSTSLTVAEVDHPVTRGVDDFTDTSTYVESPQPLDAGATTLVSGCERTVVSVAEPAGTGRQVYLGMIFVGNEGSYDNTGLRTGEADQLIEQAIAWAGSCSDGDDDGAWSCATDCDDSDPDRFEGNPEICDGVDNDCDDVVPADELDSDDDGMSTCEGDCDDGDELRFPGNTEACDGIDNDCDDVIPANELDEDADGVSACEGDCDDEDDLRFPGNEEICDAIDNDCNDAVDDGLPTETLYLDGDGDGYGDPASEFEDCDASLGITEAGDCDDSASDVFPGAEEIRGDDVDQDCDGEDLGGCGCASGPTGGVWLFPFLGALLLGRRRRPA